jgi:hypothetical protein
LDSGGHRAGRFSEGGEPYIEGGRIGLMAASSRCSASDEEIACDFGVITGESDADDGVESSPGNEEEVPMTLPEPKWEVGIGIALDRLPVSSAGV